MVSKEGKKLSLLTPTHFETSEQFSNRKRDHIRLSLDDRNEAVGGSELDKIQLIHEALPEIDFDEVEINQISLGMDLKTPFLVSSMTAGHRDAININKILAQVCEKKSWLMGVGSQRRELHDPEASKEWQAVRKSAPQALLLGNLGLSQLIQTSVSEVERLVESLEASAMIIHTNPLQECLQPEGTPQFRGGLKALEQVCAQLSVPVILKETGCGFSESTLKKLKSIGLAAVDISGFGGTHWGRIEGDRAGEQTLHSRAANVFSDWGVSTLASLRNANAAKVNYEFWASGGIRSGLDAAKVLSLGAKIVGFAKPVLQAALAGEEVLCKFMDAVEFELKTAMFCSGCNNLAKLKNKSSVKEGEV